MSRIGVDAMTVGTRQTGAARFLLNLLSELPGADPGLTYVALVSPDGADAVRRRAPGVDVRIVDPRGGLAWELRGSARAAAGSAVELLFTVRELIPLGGPGVLVHVFEPPAYRLRAFGPPSLREARRYAKDIVLHLALGRSLRRARAVTAGSRTTAAWLCEHVGVEAEVVLPGIDPAFFVEALPAAEPRHVLHLSSGDPRDNTELVLRAFATGRCGGLRLVVAGSAQSVVARRAASLGVEVEVTGWVSDERLRELYRGAVALVHPTKYEGFAGYPALEAMALGTPVVALDAPGAREALADRAVLVPREDPVALADAIARLRDEAPLREELSARGREFARSLTWASATARFAAAFRRALGRDR